MKEEKFKGKNLYVAKTLRMANYIAKKFDILKLGTDENNPKYKVFLFEDSNELREYMNGYSEYCKNNKFKK